MHHLNHCFKEEGKYCNQDNFHLKCHISLNQGGVVKSRNGKNRLALMTFGLLTVVKWEGVGRQLSPYIMGFSPTNSCSCFQPIMSLVCGSVANPFL